MCNNLGLPQLLLVIILTIGSAESRSSRKLPEPPQDGAAGLHLNIGLDDCGEDSHSSCDSWAKSGECEKDPEVKQSCSFSCSLSGQLWEAALTGNKSIVEITIAAGANPLCTKTEEYVTEYDFVRVYGVDNYTAIHMAAMAGHPSIIETLLNAGVDVNLQTTKGPTPIYIAAQKGNIDALDILIENNANVNILGSDGRTPLMGAAYNITRALIKANASLDVTGGSFDATALYYAVSNQDVALLLIEHNANVNIPSSGGWTPLMEAARNAELNITRALIKANASIDVTGGYDNATALYYAVVSGGNQDVALLLIEHNANVNIPNSGGWTPLLRAAWYGKLNITRALIKANASLDVTGGRLGATALHYAATRNNQDVAVLLMVNGADSSITNKLGQNPADVARSKGHNQLADLIESYPTTHRLILSR